jgi:hypothetical protein
MRESYLPRKDENENDCSQQSALETNASSGKDALTAVMAMAMTTLPATVVRRPGSPLL